jgi:hypothetical protein
MLDPLYRVVRPNGGEIFHVGEQCTVIVHSEVPANAILLLRVRAGRSSYPLRGSLGSINPFADTMCIFTVPDSFDVLSGGNTTRANAISDSCYIALNDYEMSSNGYHDYSDCYFGIRRRPGGP